jgi:hypothetical protein
VSATDEETEGVSALVDATRVSVRQPADNADSSIGVWLDYEGTPILEFFYDASGRKRTESFILEDESDARNLARVLAHAIGTELADESDSEP